MAAGVSRTNLSSVGWNIGIARASSIMVRSINSTAIGFSRTMCWAAFIASWKLPKWQAPTARLPSSGASFNSMRVEKASVPSAPTSTCARLMSFLPGTSASRL